MTYRLSLLVFALASISALSPARADDADLRDRAAKALRQATAFFRTKVATEGGYLWRYSDDLARREGEGKASATQVWVQPPGTPAVGLAYLGAYQATGDPYYLEAARETAMALVRGQLRSGGWHYAIEFDPSLRKKVAYRIDGGNDKSRNVTTLDDNTTQTALRLLMRVDQALKFKDAKIHEAAEYALSSLLKAQYPNGAWPQGYDRFPDAAQFPVKKASFPESWPRAPQRKDYWTFYTLNDNVLADMVDVMLEASRVYGEAKYRQAAEKAGGFLLLAQLPDPQPAWAQQYDPDMHPAWARRFEPPAVTGGESQGALRTLLRLYHDTGDKKYLEPVPRALDYLRKSRLPDGRLARFYELKTNKPLYFTKDYQLTDKDNDLPTHYAFKVPDGTEAIVREYERLKKLDPAELKKPAAPRWPELTAALTAKVKEVIAALDDKGRWLSNGRLRSQGGDDPTKRIIECQTFITNVGVLSQYLAATRK
jgi:PelA/Pel-15E family pectate lyase